MGCSFSHGSSVQVTAAAAVAPRVRATRVLVYCAPAVLCTHIYLYVVYIVIMQYEGIQCTNGIHAAAHRVAEHAVRSSPGGRGRWGRVVDEHVHGQGGADDRRHVRAHTGPIRRVTRSAGNL